MSLAAFFDFVRLDFDRSVKSLVEERQSLISERNRRVRHHQAVADLDARLKYLTHALLRRRRVSMWRRAA